MVCGGCQKAIIIESRIYELTNNLFAKLKDEKLHLYQVETLHFCGIACLYKWIKRQYALSFESLEGTVQGPTVKTDFSTRVIPDKGPPRNTFHNVSKIRKS